VDASFGEEERWTTANVEENAAAMQIEDAARLEIEANEAVPAPWYVFAFVECCYSFVCICSHFYLWLIILFDSSREKGTTDEETEVQPSSEGEFEAMAFDGFQAIREEEEGVIVPVVPLKIIEPTDDLHLDTGSRSTPSAPPRP
jgi:hypothetical protein